MAFLNISTKNKKGVLSDIDRQNYFCLGNSSLARLGLYNFVLALGYNNGLPTDLDTPKESFVREEYINNNRYLYAAVYFSKHEQKCIENIESLTDKDNIHILMDKYANTGFSVLADYMKDFGEKALAMKLIAEMDEMNMQFLHDFAE